MRPVIRYKEIIPAGRTNTQLIWFRRWRPPVPASGNLLSSWNWAERIFLIAWAVQIIPIIAPFPDISIHIVTAIIAHSIIACASSIKIPHRSCPITGTIVKVIITLGRIYAVSPGITCFSLQVIVPWSSLCPFRFGGQALPIKISISFRAIPGNIPDRVVFPACCYSKDSSWFIYFDIASIAEINFASSYCSTSAALGLICW